MKLFEVEIKRISYLTLTIEARNEVEAEVLALDQIKLDDRMNLKAPIWRLNLFQR
jgi:hypothetical protein